jgi:putative ABC transport system permease protein
MSLGARLTTTKILRDLWLNRARTGMVVVSIALSVAAFGVLNTARAVILNVYTAAYLQAEPAQVILTLPDFDEKLLDKARSLPEVRLAEGRRAFDLKFKSGGTIYNITTYASPNPTGARISRLAWEGAPPARLNKGEVLLDHTIQSLRVVTPGQEISVQTIDGRSHRLTIAGLPNDLISMPTQYTLTGQAFVNLDTAESLGQRRAFNQLIVVTQASGAGLAALQAEIQRQAEQISHELEQAGYPVLATEIPVAGRPPLYNMINALMLLLQMFGFLIVLVTGLVVSIVAAALIAEQTNQVGILKTLGSSSSGVLGIYSQMVLIIGSSALLIAIPLVWWVARWGAGMVASQIDTPMRDFQIPLSTWVGLPLLAFGVTFIAVFRPLWRASRLSIRQAISEETPLPAGQAVLNVGSMLARNSLRTLLRKRQRLFLNLLMLSLAGAMFVTALNIRREIQVLGARIQQRNNFDIFVGLSETVKRSALEHTARNIPGVSDAQAYLSGSIERVLPDGSLAGSVPVLAVPSGSDYHRLALVSGQWPPPENGIVLSSEAMEIWGLTGDPLPTVGTPLRVNIAGRQANCVLAGIMGKVTRPVAYIPYASYAALTRQMGMANMIAVRLAPGASSQEVSKRLPGALEQVGYSILYSDDVPHSNAAQMAAFNIPIYALLGIVALTALVGGLGLASTLSISVIERRREIGILRSMGAGPELIRRLVLTEGLLIGLFSLPLAWLLAWPLTLAMGQIVVVATIGFTPPLIYLPGPALVWGVLVCGLALCSSWMPARQASRLSIRETLIYTG